jgi:hypothetical protein
MKKLLLSLSLFVFASIAQACPDVKDCPMHKSMMEKCEHHMEEMKKSMDSSMSNLISDSSKSSKSIDSSDSKKSLSMHEKIHLMETKEELSKCDHKDCNEMHSKPEQCSPKK